MNIAIYLVTYIYISICIYNKKTYLMYHIQKNLILNKKFNYMKKIIV